MQKNNLVGTDFWYFLKYFMILRSFFTELQTLYAVNSSQKGTFKKNQIKKIKIFTFLTNFTSAIFKRVFLPDKISLTNAALISLSGGQYYFALLVKNSIMMFILGIFFKNLLGAKLIVLFGLLICISCDCTFYSSLYCRC